MKKIKWEKIEKQILKLLDKKITIASVIAIIASEMIISTIIVANKPKYLYVDMNNSNGTSNNCYYNDDSKDLRCMIPVKVQQYSKEN